MRPFSIPAATKFVPAMHSILMMATLSSSYENALVFSDSLEIIKKKAIMQMSFE